MVTSRDVARVAGVSQTTVSRVIQESPSVRPETRERVLRAFDELGYTPNAMARAMKTRRTGTIGVVVNNLTNPLYPQVVEALSSAIDDSGRRMLLWNSGAAGERSAIHAIQERLVDGVIFTTATLDLPDQASPLAEALRLGAPSVLVNRGVPTLESDQILSDNQGGADKVVRYLANAGHRRIGFIGGPPNASTAVEREDAFMQTMREVGLAVDPDLVAHGDFTHDAGEQHSRRMMGRAEPATAIFCVNDVSAFGVIGTARALGIRVPEDLWVVGFNDIEQAAWPALDLTTIRQDRFGIATCAVELLIARIDDPHRPCEVRRFPTELIIRGSTGHHPAPTAMKNP